MQGNCALLIHYVWANWSFLTYKNSQCANPPELTIVSFDILFFTFAGFTKVRFDKLQRHCFQIVEWGIGTTCTIFVHCFDELILYIANKCGINYNYYEVCKLILHPSKLRFANNKGIFCSGYKSNFCFNQRLYIEITKCIRISNKGKF